MSDVRIKFLKNVPVDLASIPKSARGRCLKIVPSVSPILQGREFVMPSSPPAAWSFPVGAVVQLSEDIASQYLAAGVAEKYESITGLGTFNCDEPEERRSMV